MSRLRLTWTYSAALAVAAACGGTGITNGGDGGADVDGAGANAEPMLIPGGGVRSGAIDGVLHVHAIDVADDAPLAGATVYVGAPQGSTDSSGLISFQDGSLSGAQTITVTAGGYATATWIGANGTNVTVPLSRSPSATPQAHVEGTIAGWDSLSAPNLGEYNLAVVLYSFTADFGAPENSIAQPMSGSDPLNLCVRTPFDNPSCNWQMNTRTGPQVHFAVILRGQDKGTVEPDDDTYTLLGFAMKAGQNPSSGQTLTGQSLSMVDIGGFANATVSFPGAPSGAQTDRLAIPFVDMGAEGQLPIPLPTLTPASPTTRVPPLSGPFSGAHYNVVSLAVPAGAAERPFSSSFARDVALSGTLALPAWLPPPAQLQAGSSGFSFGAVPGASAHAATFLTAGGQTVWSVTILDGTQTFRLPVGAPAPLPSGSLEMRVTAIQLPGFDPGSFTFADLGSRLAAVSDDAIAFTR